MNMVCIFECILIIVIMDIGHAMDGSSHSEGTIWPNPPTDSNPDAWLGYMFEFIEGYSGTLLSYARAHFRRVLNENKMQSALSTHCHGVFHIPKPEIETRYILACRVLENYVIPQLSNSNDIPFINEQYSRALNGLFKFLTTNNNAKVKSKIQGAREKTGTCPAMPAICLGIIVSAAACSMWEVVTCDFMAKYAFKLIS